MSDRRLTRHFERSTADSLWSHSVAIERLSSGVPGIIVTITVIDPAGRATETSVVVDDANEFLAPVLSWLKGNDPEPYVDQHGSTRSYDGNPAGHDFDTRFTFAPREGYNQSREDYR